MKIENIETIGELVAIIYEAVKNRLTFRAYKVGSKWEVEFLGGY